VPTTCNKLLSKHGFLPGVAGHAAYGNLHFTLTPILSEEADKERYGAFMSDLVDLVIGKYDGSLKAEHGTGRNMAPFVKNEWGAKATDIMWRLKRLADPHGILGPDVILTTDEEIHLKDFKSTPKIEQAANLCIECGFCEAVCPSRNVTTTPRQRIALRQEMARQPEDSPVLAQLQAEYEYDGIETCAADGTCAIPCPVQINTGDLIKGFRRAESTTSREHAGLAAAKHWGQIERLARRAMSAVNGVQSRMDVKVLTELTNAARCVASSDLIPSTPGPMPHPAPAHLPHTERQSARAVYFPTCINRIFGRDPDKPRTPSLPEAFVTLSARAGMPLWIPDDVRGLCCSTPWASKGLADGHQWMAEAICDALWRWTDHGSLPIVIDASSCTHGLLEDVAKHVDDSRRAQMEAMSIRDSITWCRDLLPHLSANRKLETVALHPTCSTTHLGLNHDLKTIASFLADTTVVPVGTTCCGTAGDRGLLHPELVVSATRDEKAGLEASAAQANLSANRTCEMGLRHATGQPYESFIFPLEELTRPA
jgi:D-lactate dehydrogenase